VSKARMPGETPEGWAWRNFFTAEERAALALYHARSRFCFDPPRPRGDLAIEIGRRLAVWDRLVLTWPEDRPVDGLYEAVLEEATTTSP
jgi:hypothetical protein